jgi:hypothetical protein
VLRSTIIPFLPDSSPTWTIKSKRKHWSDSKQEGRKKRKTSLALFSTVSPSLEPWYQALNSGQKVEFFQGVRLAKMKSEKKRLMKEQRLFNAGKVVHPYFSAPAILAGDAKSIKSSLGTQNYREFWDGVDCPSFPDQFCNHVAPGMQHSPRIRYKLRYRSDPVVMKQITWPERLSKPLDETPVRNRPNITIKAKAYQTFKSCNHFAE